MPCPFGQPAGIGIGEDHSPVRPIHQVRGAITDEPATKLRPARAINALGIARIDPAIPIEDVTDTQNRTFMAIDPLAISIIPNGVIGDGAGLGGIEDHKQCCGVALE